MPKAAENKLCLVCHGEYPGELATCPSDGTVLTTVTDDDLTGSVLDDRYEILDVIGGGGMGMVYRAKQRFIDRVVAVKVLHKGSISSTDTLKRFQLEGQAASQLSNPHIVTVFDANVSKDGEPYIVMDYLEGDSLEAIIEKQGPLPVARAVPIFMQICDALGKAHAKDIVHRDIKPSNIVLVNEDGEADFVKLVDFGIAKILRESEQHTGNLTRTGEIFGSPLYMSPEQWRGGKLDSRADCYSLGAVMYKTVSGQPLFHGSDFLQLAYKHTQETPPTFAELCVPVPPPLEAVIRKALEKEPEDRYQTMGALKQALADVMVTLAGSENYTPLKGKSGGADIETTIKSAAVSSETQAWLKDLTPVKVSAELPHEKEEVKTQEKEGNEEKATKPAASKNNLKIGAVAAAVVAAAGFGLGALHNTNHQTEPSVKGREPAAGTTFDTTVSPPPATTMPQASPSSTAAPPPVPLVKKTATGSPPSPPPPAENERTKVEHAAKTRAHAHAAPRKSKSSGLGIKKVLHKILRKL